MPESQRCLVYGCGHSRNKSSAGISFHKFPKDETVKQRWINIVKVTSAITPSSAVCSKHFRTDDYESANVLSDAEGVCVSKRLKRDSVPSVSVEAQRPLQSTGTSLCDSKSASVEENACSSNILSPSPLHSTSVRSGRHPTNVENVCASTSEPFQPMHMGQLQVQRVHILPITMIIAQGPLQCTGASSCMSESTNVEEAWTSSPMCTGESSCTSQSTNVKEEACISTPLLPSQPSKKLYRVKGIQTNKVHIKYRSVRCQTSTSNLYGTRTTECQTRLTMKDIHLMEKSFSKSSSAIPFDNDSAVEKCFRSSGSHLLRKTA